MVPTHVYYNQSHNLQHAPLLQMDAPRMMLIWNVVQNVEGDALKVLVIRLILAVIHQAHHQFVEDVLRGHIHKIARLALLYNITLL